MKQSIPTPVVIGVIAVVIIVVGAFFFMRGSSSDGFNAKTSERLQAENYKRMQQGGGVRPGAPNASSAPR